MPDEIFELPEIPFFSCEEDGFAIADGERRQTTRAALILEPVFKLKVGPGNVFERRPLRVIEYEGHNVVVECEGGETVYLDFYELKARKESPDGGWYYRGPLDEGNDALGFMPAR